MGECPRGSHLHLRCVVGSNDRPREVGDHQRRALIRNPPLLEFYGPILIGSARGYSVLPAAWDAGLLV